MAEGAALTFADLLRRYRLAKGLTQEELAERAGLSLRGISDLERGARRAPRRETVLLLAEALGLPEEKRAALERAVRKPASLSDPFAEPPSRRSHLPAQTTPFIGREGEVGAVRQRLLEPAVRLLTLTGPGGVGKTRLALQVADEVQAGFLDGVSFVGLASITDPALVPSTLAQVVGLPEAGAGTLLEGLTQYLRPRQMLLVLDNFEHLMSAGQLLAQLLSACSRLKLLVTSRAVLHLSGEHVYTVPPLALPAPQERLPGEQLLRYAALRLFVERAWASRSEFTLTEENAQTVAEICRRLDGLPLAIELAAARVGLLPPQTMLVRLDSRLKLLTRGARDLPPRQQTLRATLDWSYGLLDEAEQKLFARLAIFAGTWTLPAAEAVCDVGGELDVADVLAALLDNSLITRADAVGGEPRLRMLETVREYALERLEARGEAAALRSKHAEYYLDLAERTEPELRGPAQMAALNRLEQEHDNLRAVMEWLLKRGAAQPEDIGTAVRLAWAVWLHWVMRGHLSEGRRWMEEVLPRATALPADLRAKALGVLGIVLNALGTFPQTIQLLEESAALFRQVGDQRGTAIALTGVGIAAMKQGEPERAGELLEKALEIYRGLGDQWGIAQMLPYLGMIALGRADSARAIEYFDEGLALAREMGDRLAIYKSLHNLARAAQALGDSERATDLYGEGLMLAEELGDRAGVAYCLEGLAGVAGARGEPERAARLLGAAEALLEAVGVPRYPYVLDHAVRDRMVAAARAQLSEPAFATAWAEGRAMTVEQAIAHAFDRAEQS